MKIRKVAVVTAEYNPGETPNGRVVEVYRDAEYDQWIVKNGNPAADCFEATLEAAMETAKAMANWPSPAQHDELNRQLSEGTITFSQYRSNFGPTVPCSHRGNSRCSQCSR